MGRQPLAYAKVLDAAEVVLVSRSAAAFTLDAVAAQAGVSKGGLMYHFPSKEALLTALVARAVAAVDGALEAAAAADPRPGAFTRAYLDSTVPIEPPDETGSIEPPATTGSAMPPDKAALVALRDETGSITPPDETGPLTLTDKSGETASSGGTVLSGDPEPARRDAQVAALVAAVAMDPQLVAPLREAYGRWQVRLENDGLDPAAATAVRLAVDGWWLAALLGLPALDPGVHRRTRALLASLTDAHHHSS